LYLLNEGKNFNDILDITELTFVSTGFDDWFKIGTIKLADNINQSAIAKHAPIILSNIDKYKNLNILKISNPTRKIPIAAAINIK
jgi:hypothetical protein